MPVLKFKKLSSEGDEAYELTATYTDGRLRFICQCAAAENGQSCRHRIETLNGELKGLISNNPNDVATLGQWLKGTPIDEAMKAITALEHRQAEIKSELSKARKRLGAALEGK